MSKNGIRCDQECGAQYERNPRPAHHAARGPCPETSSSVLAPVVELALLDERNPEFIDLVSHDAESRRKESQRRQYGYENYRDGAEPKADKHTLWNYEQPDQGENNGQSAEETGAPGGRWPSSTIPERTGIHCSHSCI